MGWLIWFMSDVGRATSVRFCCLKSGAARRVTTEGMICQSASAVQTNRSVPKRHSAGPAELRFSFAFASLRFFATFARTSCLAFSVLFFAQRRQERQSKEVPSSTLRTSPSTWLVRLPIFDICLVNIYNEALRKRYEMTIDSQQHL